MRSDISRLRARFGSKFSGEQACCMYRWRVEGPASPMVPKRSRAAMRAEDASIRKAVQRVEPRKGMRIYSRCSRASGKLVRCCDAEDGRWWGEPWAAFDLG